MLWLTKAFKLESDFETSILCFDLLTYFCTLTFGIIPHSFKKVKLFFFFLEFLKKRCYNSLANKGFKDVRKVVNFYVKFL